MKSPRTGHEFHISSEGLKKVENRTWKMSDEDFVRIVRLVFGLEEEGPPPIWHFLETMQIVKDSGLDA